MLLELGNVRGVANVEAPHDAGIERTEIHDYHQVVDPRDRCGHGSSFVTFAFFFRYASSSSSGPAVNHQVPGREKVVHRGQAPELLSLGQHDVKRDSEYPAVHHAGHPYVVLF